MFRIILSTLRFRTGGLVASFVALFFGAAIIMACGGIMETGIRLAVPPQRLAGSPIVVTGNQSFPERVRLSGDVLGKVQAVPGVATATPDISFPISLVQNDEPTTDLLEGHAWSSAHLAPFIVNAGAAPQTAGEVALEAGLAGQANLQPGDRARFMLRGVSKDFTVTGIVGSNSAHMPTAFFAEHDALAAYGGETNTIDTIGVTVAPGSDLSTVAQDIRTALKDQKAAVLIDDKRGQAEFPYALAAQETLIVLAAVFGGLAVMVAVFIVASTLGLSVQQRMREMALLRAIGATPGQIRRMIITETGIISVFATALAVIPGMYGGAFLMRQLTDTGAVPSVIQFHQGELPILTAALVGLMTALGAAFIAASGAARVKPIEALASASMPTKWFNWMRLTAALLCLGGGLTLALVTALVMSGPVAASTAAPAAMLWAGGLALLSPGLTKIIAWVLQVPLRMVSGMSGYLAVLNIKARTIRLASAVVPIMLTTGLATSMVYLQTTQNSYVQRLFSTSLRADAVITSSAGGLPVGLVDTVQKQLGVASASALVTSEGYFVNNHVDEDGDSEMYEDTVALQGLTASGAASTTALAVTKGSLTDLKANTVALPENIAQKHGYSLGQPVQLELGDGTPVTLTLIALFTPLPNFETVLLPADLLAQHTTSGLVPQILVQAQSGTSASELIQNLEKLSASQPGLHVADRQTIISTVAATEQTGAWINYLLVAMIIGYTVISLVNTMVATTLERKRELALQRLIGSTRLQVLWMMGLEGMFVALAGIILGAFISIVTLAPFGIALKGSPLPEGPLWIYLAIVGFATILALAATLLPTLAVLRARPVEAATNRE